MSDEISPFGMLDNDDAGPDPLAIRDQVPNRTGLPDGWVDARDYPAASPWQDTVPSDEPGHQFERTPAGIIKAMPVRHVATRIIRARTVTIGVSAADVPTLLGLEPGAVQAQGIHYMLISVTPAATGALYIAGADVAMPTDRFRVPMGTAASGVAAEPLVLPGIAGVQAWAVGASVEVAFMIVGEASN